MTTHKTPSHFTTYVYLPILRLPDASPCVVVGASIDFIYGGIEVEGVNPNPISYLPILTKIPNLL
jgi:hypothetical protein